MNRRDFLQSVGLGTAFLGMQGSLFGCSGYGEKPNIIFIMADDLGFGDLGCYGSGLIDTPHCDRLAHEGVRFTDAHSPSAVCSPTRYGVLTGRYSWRTWLKNWIVMQHMPLLIDTDRLTVGSMLRQHGYTTGCVGKWHLGWGRERDPDWSGSLGPGPLDVGFDYYFGVPYSHNSMPRLQVFVKNKSIVGLNPGDDVNDPGTLKRVQRNLPDTAVNLSAEVVQFMERNRDRPFFLYYPTTNVHLPHTPNERFQGISRVGTYGDFVVEFDWAVGQVLKTLDRLRLTERTLVIVTSDNGGHQYDGLGGHRVNGPWRGIKTEIYEGGHRVPFIASWPGRIAPGTVSDKTICLTDLMATCASIVGHDLPADAGEDSFDILPVLPGETHDSPIRKAVIHHSCAGMFAIREGKWKLIEGIGSGMRSDWPKTSASGTGKPERNLETGRFKDVTYYFPPLPEAGPGEPPGQLYNLENDPGEMDNLWKRHPEVVEHLLTLLNRYRDQGHSKSE